MTEKQNPFSEDKHQIQELLKIYSNLKNGTGHSYLDEESFDRIISHYQDKDDLKNAFEAAELATGQFPWCADLLIKKADILLAKRRYNEALAILDKAELLDSKDINLYICKTDAYLALEMEEEAISLLQNALTIFEGEERIELLFELGDVYDYYEDFDKVFESLKMILELEPNNEEALYKICFCMVQSGGSLPRYKIV